MSTDVSTPATNGRPLLELDQVSLTFGGLKALNGLELRVADKEIVSVIGPNGAGKTTVFNVVTGVYDPSDGDIRLAGQSIAGKSPSSDQTALIASVGRGGARSTSAMPGGSCSRNELTTRPTPRPCAMW